MGFWKRFELKHSEQSLSYPIESFSLREKIRGGMQDGGWSEGCENFKGSSKPHFERWSEGHLFEVSYCGIWHFLVHTTRCRSGGAQ